MSEMLEQLELTVRPLTQNGSREGFHDLFDRHRSARELVLCGTTRFVSYSVEFRMSL